MKNINSFLPLVYEQSEILILGSMPSVVSLYKHEYYGHERNAFWPIMCALFSEKAACKRSEYSLRKELLMINNIAVWDVLQSCSRTGSLDADIKMDTIKVNDFFLFFTTYRHIKKIFFNGKKAETLYKKHILPTIIQQFSYLEYRSLPSTSPAYATMSVEKKTKVWKKQLALDK